MMTDQEFQAMKSALESAQRRFPHCRIAACDCHGKTGEWKAGCACLCHFFHMNDKHGADNWTLDQFREQAKTGLPIGPH